MKLRSAQCRSACVPRCKANLWISWDTKISVYGEACSMDLDASVVCKDDGREVVFVKLTHSCFGMTWLEYLWHFKCLFEMLRPSYRPKLTVTPVPTPVALEVLLECGTSFRVPIQRSSEIVTLCEIVRYVAGTIPYKGCLTAGDSGERKPQITGYGQAASKKCKRHPNSRNKQLQQMRFCFVLL